MTEADNKGVCNVEKKPIVINLQQLKVNMLL